LLKRLHALYCEYSSLHEWGSNVNNTYLKVVGNTVDLYTTNSLIFMCVYLAYLSLTSFMLLNRNVRLLAVMITNKE